MPTIQVLRPNVTREEALQQFSRGLPGWLRHATLGPLRLLADVYIPFYLFQVEITNGMRTETRMLGVDAISGLLDPYEFTLADTTVLLQLESNNSLAPRLAANEINKVCVEKARRVLFNRGFFKLQHPRIAASYTSRTWWVPYWVAFHGTDRNLSLSVIDAVRRKFEGAKVRTLLRDWLQKECPLAAHDRAQSSGERALPAR
jgi:hypothetical protein